MNTSQPCQPTLQQSQRESRRKTNGLNRSPSYAGCSRPGLSAHAGTSGKSQRTPLPPKSSNQKAVRSRPISGSRCWSDAEVAPLT